MCKRSRSGVTLVELVTVVALSAIVVAIALPVVSVARESSRNVTCLDNLATIARASIEFDEINGTLPPYVGVPPELLDRQVSGALILSFQSAYSHVQLLRQLGFGSLADEIDPFAFEAAGSRSVFDVGYDSWNWWSGIDANMPGMRAVVLNQNIPLFRCPDDPVQLASRAVFGVQPTDVAAVSWLVLNNSDNLISVTNYAANGGGIGITANPGNGLESLAGFHGPIRSRVADSVESIPDGASNVVMFGEALGRVRPSSNFGDERHSLAGGLVFGRANIYQGVDKVFGDAEDSVSFQFGSLHPETVNIVRCDGSTMAVDRDVDEVMFGRFCGAADGLPVQLFVLGDVNQDNERDLLDVQPFVDVVVDQEFQIEADIDRNGIVDLNDVAPFVDILFDH